METKSIPELPLQIIFENLSFQDITILLQTPEWRNMVKNFYERDMNQKKIIQKVLSEIVLDFIGCESKDETTPMDILENLEKIFVQKGMKDFRKTKEYQKTFHRFLKNFDDNELESISPDDYTNMTRVNYIDFLMKNYSKFEVYDIVFDNFHMDRERYRKLNRYLMIEDESDGDIIRCNMADFVKEQISDPQNGFRNLLEFIELIPNLYPSEKSTTKWLNKMGVDQPLKKLELIEKIFPEKENGK